MSGGGTAGSGSEDDKDDSDDGGILSSIIDFLRNIIEKIVSVPQMIYQFFQDPIGNIISALEWLAKIPKMIFDLFVDTLTNIIDAVLSIPKKVFNFVKRIFIPQRSVIDDALESLKKSFNKLLFNYKLESISTGAKKFEDISVTMRGKKMVILDSSLIVSGVNKFRSIIRGFTVFLLILFDINQFLGFIGQPAISIVGGIKAIQQSGKSQEGGAE